MRRQTEKPSDPSMRFFTPALYLAFNSENDAEADRADATWEKVLEDYERHLNRLGKRVPAEVARLAELCLHDAEIHAFRKEIEPNPNGKVVWSAQALSALVVRRGRFGHAPPIALLASHPAE